MGTLMGHILPGTIFIAFGSWWLYNIFLRYFTARKFSSRGLLYKSTCTFPCPCWPPIEPALKITATTIGIIGEFYTGFENGEWTHMGNAQHITMYFFFGFSGFIDFLYYKKFQLPPNLDYMSATLAFGVEALLFFYHLHGRSSMDVQVHMFLVYTVVSCAVSAIMEMHRKHHVLPALSRTFFTILQGTWFYQVGFMLYPPIGEGWNQENHRQMMLATLLFTWHIGALMCVFVAVGLLVYWKVKRMNPPEVMYHQLPEDLGPKINGVVEMTRKEYLLKSTIETDESDGV